MRQQEGPSFAERLSKAAALASAILLPSGCEISSDRADKAATAQLIPVETPVLPPVPSFERWRSYPQAVRDILKEAQVLQNGKPFSLALDRHTALVFANSAADLTETFRGSLNAMAGTYGEKPGVNFVVVLPESAELPPSAEMTIPSFFLLHDTAGMLAGLLHAERSGEVLLLDTQQKLVYRGAIDSTGSTTPLATPVIRYLDQVLDALATDTPVKYTVTDAGGPLLSSAAKPHFYPDFTTDIGPLTDKHCTYCHRPGDVGSILPLVDHQSIASSAMDVSERVSERLMPPWRLDSRFGSFANNSQLDVNEIWAFRAWDRLQRPHGNGAYSLKAVADQTNYRLKNEDAVVHMLPEEKRGYTVPATGILPYQHFFVKTDFGEDKWLVASEIRALAPEVVHHINVFVLHPIDDPILDNRAINAVARRVAARNYGIDPKEFNNVYRLYGAGMKRQLFLIGNYTPSHTALRFSQEHGVLIPRGSEIVFECHYTPNGKETLDRSALALKFASEVPADAFGKQAITRSGAPELRSLQIGPGETKELTRTMTYYADAELMSLRPHMHLRGYDFRAYLDRPGQERELIMYVPAWDYQWQVVYNYENPVQMPAGSKLHLVYRWDNSSSNPFNPAPDESVRFGTKINDEMGMAWPTYSYRNPKEVEQAEALLQDNLSSDPISGEEPAVEKKD